MGLTGSLMSRIAPILDNNGFRTTFADREVDGFGRQTTSTPTIRFDSQLQYDLQESIWDSHGENASFTHIPEHSACEMKLGPGGGHACRQTYQYFRYESGISQLFKGTGVMYLNNSENALKEILYGDHRCGLGFRQRGIGNFEFFIRKHDFNGNVTERIIPREKWSKDPKSRLSTDISVLFFVDLEWLSVGQIRFGFWLDGRKYICYKEKNEELVGAYMPTANLPVRYHVESDTEETMWQICSTVIREAGGVVEGLGYPHALINSSPKDITETTEWTQLLTLRPRLLYKGQENHIPISIDNVNVTANFPATTALLYRHDISSSTWNDVDADSSLEFSEDAVVSGGRILRPSFVLGSATTDGTGGNQTTTLNPSSGRLDFPVRLPISTNMYATDAIAVSVLVKPIYPDQLGDALATIDWIEQR